MNQIVKRFANWRGWPWRTFAIPGILFLITAIYALTHYYPFFYFDHWDLVPMIEARDAGQLKAGQVFALHGYHWHASGYVIMLALGIVTGHAQSAEVIVSLLLAGTAFFGVLKLLKRQIGVLESDVNWFVPTAIAALFIFSLDQSQNWLWGWQTAVFVHLVGVVWCIERLTRDVISWRDTVIAAGLAALAIYGFGTGWALIPIGFAILAARKRVLAAERWHNLAVWSVFSALVLWHMSLAMNAQALASTAAASVEQSAPFYAYGLYAMNYVANAVTRFSPDIALAIFLLSAGAALWCMRQFLQGSAATPLKLAPALSLMAYAVGAGLLTSLGRLDGFGPDTAFLGRYITFANLYWLGLIGLVFAVRGGVPKKARRGIGIGIGVLCVMKLGTIGNVVGSGAPHAVQVRQSIATVRACYPNHTKEDLTGLFAPSQMKRAGHALAYLHDNRLSAFASPPASDIQCAPASPQDPA